MEQLETVIEADWNQFGWFVGQKKLWALEVDIANEYIPFHDGMTRGDAEMFKILKCIQVQSVYERP